MSERPFDPARFAEHRTALGLGWGQPLTHFLEIGSTNDEALKAARAGAPAGSVFVADHQSAGRGRSGKTWQSRAGAGLLFSVLIRPETSPDNLASLTLAVGLGVRAALAKLATGDFSVKWPNDVLGGGRKVAGVLCEGQLSGRRVEAVVVGVGINIERQELPPDVTAAAVSLEELALQNFGVAGGALPEREALLAEALAAIEARAARYFAHGFTALHDEFTEHDALSGRRVSVSGASDLSGVARGVDRTGQLLVENEGLVIAVRSGTVRHDG